MGFQVTTPTIIPVNPDGSQDQLTFAEAGGPWSPSAKEGPGYAVGNPLPAGDVNYQAQAAGRWSRATANRTVLSDEGLFSTSVVSQGTFNVSGGTLNITLTPSRVVVDVNADGGVVLEVSAPAGSPEALPANTDTYVSLDETGLVDVTSVPNGDPAPAPPLGYAQIWKLETDGVELIQVDVIQGVCPFPCFAEVGARNMITEELNSLGPAVFSQNIDANGGLTVAAGQTLDAKGDVVLGDAPADAIIVPGTPSFQTAINMSNAAPTIGQFSGNANFGLDLHDGTLKTVHASPGGYLRASGKQEAATVPALADTSLATTTRIAAPVNLWVTLCGYLQIAGGPGTVSLSPEQDNGALVWGALGLGQAVTVVGTGDANDWTYFRLVRLVLAPDATMRLFRLNATAAANLSLREATIEVGPA